MNASNQPVPIKETIRSGSSFGLKLDFYVNFYEPLISKNKFVGAIIKIGNSSYAAPSYGIEIAPGLKTNIIVERYFQRSLPKPYSNCDIDNDVAKTSHSDLYDLITNSPNKLEYSQQLCINLCIQREIIRECNCTSSDDYSLFVNVTACNPNDQCFNRTLQSFASVEQLKHTCIKSCPLQCNSTQFKTSISSCLLNGEFYVKWIKESVNLREDFVNRSINGETIRNSMVRLHVFYEALAYTESVEMVSRSSILSLAANIGGILSLFLGISVLSLFEVVELIIQICFIKNV